MIYILAGYNPLMSITAHSEYHNIKYITLILLSIVHGIDLSDISDLGPRWSDLYQIGQVWDFFNISFQYILARGAKMYRKLIFKSFKFVPFNTLLTHTGPKSDIKYWHDLMSIKQKWSREIAFNAVETGCMEQGEWTGMSDLTQN